MTNVQFEALQKAIAACGGRVELARRLSPPVSRQAIESWLKKQSIPVRRIPAIAKMAGMQPGDLDPALFGTSRA